MQFISILGLSAALTANLAAAQGASGSGQTTRYWDCCKPSCAWTEKTNSGKMIGTCSKSDQPLNDGGATKSACDAGGSAFMCSNQSPWAVNDTVSYGWAAVKLSGQTETTWCCACYELTFTSGPVSGKKMIVQASNTGGDLGDNHFDLAVCYHHLSFYYTSTYTDTHPTDPRWRRRHLQRLHRPVRRAGERVGRAVRRRFVARGLRRLPRGPERRVLLALRLVRRRG